jgi:ribose/xylose/arabinose/galactoside ABC-type transport system permease subunit
MKKKLFLLAFCLLIRIFAADMQSNNRLINIILAVIAAGLLAVCVASVMSAR